MSKKIKTEPIIHFGDPLLRTVCGKTEVFHKGLYEKIDLIAATLKNHGGGAALAAPQISLLKRIIVIHYLGEHFELINPEILEQSGESVDYEGCLSLPGFSGRVKRFENITVRYQDRNGDFHAAERNGRMARCFQHEIDHLNGILYIDRMTEPFVYNDDTGEKIAVKDLLKLTPPRP